MPVAIDSNILRNYLAGERTLVERFAVIDAVWLPLPVLGEAWFAVLKSSRQRQNQERLHAFLDLCYVPPLTMRTAEVYADIRMALQRKGGPIPNNDIWIAAACLEHDLPLATRDSDFQHVNGLVVLNW